MTLRSNIDEQQILVKLMLYQDSLILKKTTGNEDLIIAGVSEDITMKQEDTMRQLPVSKKDIQIMTSEDSELKELSEIIKKGFWPKVKPGSNWNAFQSKAADLTLHDGILFMGVRAVIPKKTTTAYIEDATSGSSRNYENENAGQTVGVLAWNR